MSDEHDLSVILDSHFPIITIETHEEKRAISLVSKVTRRSERSLYIWTITEGLKNHILTMTANEMSLQSDNSYVIDQAATEPDQTLKSIKNTIKNSVVILVDFHSYIEEPKTLRLLKEVALNQYDTRNTIVLLSHDIDPPEEISRLCASFKLSLPSNDKIEQIIYDEAKVWTIKNKNQRVKTDKKSIELMVRNLQGLTISDTKRLVRNAIYNDGAITQCDLPAIMKAKYELLGQDGILSFEYDTTQFKDVGGFDKLVNWITQRKEAFLQNDQAPIDIPKGVLLLGVQGCGKSLAAKAIAGIWEVPLLRLDFGALYNKFFGETEKNIRESLKTAEVMSPCVLWMDEIEKGIATGDNDNGTSRRVLASLLTWMADNKTPVFIVATANDITTLPPELIRKGRMDEIFFVDLPTSGARENIFEIHLRKRNNDHNRFDIAALAEKSQGFSGAEIEQAIVSAIYATYGSEEALDTKHILEELATTQPLSVVMSEKIAALRKWADGRTVNVQ